MGLKEQAMLVGLMLLTLGCGTQLAPATPPASTQAAPSASPSVTSATELVVVGLGDSIGAQPGPECPGCTPFVDRYADALAAETGASVSVRNMGRPGLRVEQLLRDLETNTAVTNAVSSADAIIVAVGTSDTPWGVTDDPCDGPATGVEPVPWEEYSDDCIAAHIARLRPMVDDIFTRIIDLRSGAPTTLRTVNLYNDWIGFDAELPPAGVETSIAYNSAWNTMWCESAAANGFECGDVATAFNGSDGRSAAGDLLADDYIHPSDNGHARIATVLVDLGFAPLGD
jgi:lysophospholipase L1-like esterase